MAAAATLETNTNASITRTTLRGARLWLARALWCVTCAASLGMFAALLPLILRASDYGDWMIEKSARVFAINIFSPAFDTYALLLLSLKLLCVAVFFIVAFYIFWRKADDWLAILVSMLLLVLPHTFNLVGYTENWFVYASPWDKLLYALDALFNGLGFVLLFFVFFLFPDGRFVPRWTRWFALLSLVPVGAIFVSEFLPMQIAWDDSYSWLAVILFFLGLLLLATWSQIYRYRKVSTPAQQAQTRIVVLGLVTLVTLLTLLLLVSAFSVPFISPSFGDTPLGALTSFLVSSFALTLLPLAFGVAMLRDQLWQSERVLNRAFVYFALTTILILVYVFIIAALSEIFRAVNNFLIAAIATGVVALLFQPLRERLQRGINRFLYGQRAEPFTVLNQLGAQLENSITPDTALPLIVETIARTMRVPYAEITLTTDSRLQTTSVLYPPSAVHRPLSELETFPLRYQNETIGELKIARRAPNENFSAADIQLLENLARQAGAVAYTARLNTQLQQSREKIIAERENERKRLRRDLHDGLGPTLASQTLKLDAAIELLDDEKPETKRARDILGDLKSQTQTTVADIRRIVYELRPPALDDLGLVGALRAHLAQYNAVNGLRITFDAPNELPPLSAAVQVHAYRIVLEAVSNVMKHAGARECVVRIQADDRQQTADDRRLTLEVIDDGVGLSEDFRAGVGISSMRERAAELGGTFSIEPNEPNGTRVIATLPIADGGRSS
ncbi:GAF domain-containing sensor histidine kinase [Anaerolineae bacterium CFX7]|nr:GAF domain-containing sensor histidine kinase [Anaerolineae bacterium CFX7]